MSAFRIEYQPKPGMDVRMVRQGFDSVHTAEIYAKHNLRGAVMANVTQGQRIVRKLWRKEVCVQYASDKSDRRCWQTFDGKEQLAEHVAAVHTYRLTPEGRRS